MRTLATLLLIAIAPLTFGQDWALINPAYRYNYSDDGTDTISNQIRVMQVDTLGGDTLRYTLNRVSKVCTTCGDSCDILIDIQQFLQSECRVSDGLWSFNSPGERHIYPRASLHGEWLFDPQAGTIGVISEFAEENIFGVQDSVRTMTTELGDTVTWSKSFGILHWHVHDQPSYRLIGINGPQVGELIPTLQQFFRYQAGDVVEFLRYTCTQGHCNRRYQKFGIEQRIEQSGHIEFTGRLYQRYAPHNGVDTYSVNPNHTWVLDSALHTNFLPLRTWPGQGMTIDNMESWFINNDLFLVAKHYKDNTGSYIITGETTYGRTLSDIIDTDSTQCLSSVPINNNNNYRLDTQIGLREFSRSYAYETNSFKTVGAVINGDTIGVVHDDDFFNIVGIDELDPNAAVLFPNPASEQVIVPTARAGDTYCIMDLIGRFVTCGEVTEPPLIDVRFLQPGQYILKMQDSYPQRFIIAR